MQKNSKNESNSHTKCLLNIKLTKITTTLWIQEFTIEGLAGNDYT